MRYSQHKLTGEIDDSQHKLKQLQRNIIDLQTKLEGAKSRYQRLKDGLEIPRNRSRRFMPGVSLLKEAMQEIDSTIFAFELDLKHKNTELEKVTHFLVSIREESSS